MANTETKTNEKVKTRISTPKRWKVILLNDDYTPMEFVISVLMDIFKHTLEKAKAVTLQIHESGSGIAGTYNFEIAEAKAVEATTLSRAHNFPLQIKLEEE